MPVPAMGILELARSADPSVVQDIVTTNHDKPVYILSTPSQQGELIIPAPIIDHSDSELGLIESLVGRKTPFNSGGFSYGQDGGGGGGY